MLRDSQKKKQEKKKENIHETYHMNLYTRVMEVEDTLGWSRLRSWWMGRNQRASIENSSVFTDTVLSVLYIHTHLSAHT